MRISKICINTLDLFKEPTMSFGAVIDSVNWVKDLRQRADNLDKEAMVDYVKYKKEGIPLRFFDKTEFSNSKIEEFNDKYNLNLSYINNDYQEPPHYQLFFPSAKYTTMQLEGIKLLNKHLEKWCEDNNNDFY